jgi:hypothetical protein
MSDVQFTISGDSSQLQAALTQAQQSIGALVEKAQSGMSSIASAFSTATGAVGMLTAALSGGAIGAKLLEIADRARGIKEMSEILGVSTAQYQAMGAAADEAGVPQNRMNSALEKFSVMLEKARAGSGADIAALHQLGISNEQIADSSFDVNALWGVMHDRLTAAATATDQMSAVTAALGNKLKDVAEMMKLYNNSAAAVAAKNKEIGAASDAQLATQEKVAVAMGKFGTQLKNVGGDVVLFLAGMDEVSDHLALLAHNALLGGDALAGLKPGEAAAGWDELGDQVLKYHQLKANLDTIGTAEDIAGEKAAVEAAESGTAQKLALAQKYYKDALLYYGSGNVPEVRAAFAAMSEAQRAYYKENETLAKESTSQTISAWDNLHSRITEYLTDLGERIKEITKQQEDDAKSALNAQLGLLEQQKVADAELAKTKQTGAAQTYTNAVQNIQAQFVAWMNYYQAIAAANKDDVAAMSKNAADMAAETAKYLKEMTQASATAAETIQAAYKRTADSMASSFSTGIDQMITKQKSFAQVMQGIGAQMLQSFISYETKKLFEYIATQMATRAAAVVTTEAQVAAQQSAATQGMLIQAETSIKQILNNAYTAASGTYTSVSAIPYIGWILAPIAAAATFAAVAAMGGSISAEGGYDIPANVNPLVAAHGGEMVLPKNLADTVRDMASSGGEPAAAGGDFHFHAGGMHSLDPRTMHQIFQSPRGRAALAAGVRAHVSHGGRLSR